MNDRSDSKNKYIDSEDETMKMLVFLVDIFFLDFVGICTKRKLVGIVLWV